MDQGTDVASYRRRLYCCMLRCIIICCIFFGLWGGGGVFLVTRLDKVHVTVSDGDDCTRAVVCHHVINRQVVKAYPRLEYLINVLRAKYGANHARLAFLYKVV